VVKEKKTKNENGYGYAQKYRQIVRRVRGVSPEEEEKKKATMGRISGKGRDVLSLE